MQKITNISEIEEPLWSAVAMRATYESYIDEDDPENANIKIDRWI